MTSRESKAQLLAKMAAKMKYTPDLLDEDIKRAAQGVDELDQTTLAQLAGPVRLATPEQIELLFKIFPPEQPMPKGEVES